jgi:hypothetical protein
MPGAGAVPLVQRCGAPACTPRGKPCGWPISRLGPCQHHADADPASRCTATTRPATKCDRPARCHAWALVGRDVCSAHAPEAMTARREAQRQQRADQARARQLAALKPVRDLLALVVAVFDAELAKRGGGGPVLARVLAPQSTNGHRPGRAT